ncbi:unnamed protein product [Trichogramma brassicae]|uniref:Uncharacterized protein n=1 Tax=Trichogramma brassicae TaxID=86971 RepID=A0A6H5I9T9_9HYME|nr:unnamed protein product [Trichogramma brassicae]
MRNASDANSARHNNRRARSTEKLSRLCTLRIHLRLIRTHVICVESARPRDYNVSDDTCQRECHEENRALPEPFVTIRERCVAYLLDLIARTGRQRAIYFTILYLNKLNAHLCKYLY